MQFITSSLTLCYACARHQTKVIVFIIVLLAIELHGINYCHTGKHVPACSLVYIKYRVEYRVEYRIEYRVEYRVKYRVEYRNNFPHQMWEDSHWEQKQFSGSLFFM